MGKIFLMLVMVLGILISGCAGIDGYQKRWSRMTDKVELEKENYTKDHLKCSLLAYQAVKSERKTYFKDGFIGLLAPFALGAPINFTISAGEPAQEGDYRYTSCMVGKGYLILPEKRKIYRKRKKFLPEAPDGIFVISLP
jgi:hypothetical protein